MTIEAELNAAREIIRDYESRIQRLMAEKHEPIAIVGIGLRMPGGSTTIDGLAEYLDSGKSAIATYSAGPVACARVYRRRR